MSGGANEHDDRSQDDDAYVSEFFGVPMKDGAARTPTATPEDCCCFDCGYDLRGAKRHKSPTSDDPKDALLQCPECGWVGTLATASSHRALKHRQTLGRNALVVSAMAAAMSWGSTGAAFADGGETGCCACCCAGTATPITAAWLAGVRARARLVSTRLSNVAVGFATLAPFAGVVIALFGGLSSAPPQWLGEAFFWLGVALWCTAPLLLLVEGANLYRETRVR